MWIYSEIFGPSKMKSVLLCLSILMFAVHFSDAGVAKHGSQDKLTKDGKRNPHFDHEAILGSRKDEEDFEDLPPAEAKRRLKIMAEQMDMDNDGHVTEDELVEWIMASFKRLDEEEAREKFKEQDKDHDNMVSWKEYKDDRYHHDMSHSSEDEKARVKKDEDEDHMKFKAADKNHDHQLTLEEYIPFHLPHHHDHMHDNEVDRQLQEHDNDKDGFVNFEEFRGEDINDKNYDDEKRKEFKKYDLNNDGFLDRKEMKPWAVFDDRETAEEEAKHLIEEADDNKDMKLSIDEIVDHHEEFVGSQATDYGADLHYFKDEL